MRVQCECSTEGGNCTTGSIGLGCGPMVFALKNCHVTTSDGQTILCAVVTVWCGCLGLFGLPAACCLLPAAWAEERFPSMAAPDRGVWRWLLHHEEGGAG